MEKELFNGSKAMDMRYVSVQGSIIFHQREEELEKNGKFKRNGVFDMGWKVGEENYHRREHSVLLGCGDNKKNESEGLGF